MHHRVAPCPKYLLYYAYNKMNTGFTDMLGSWSTPLTQALDELYAAFLYFIFECCAKDMLQGKMVW